MHLTKGANMTARLRFSLILCLLTAPALAIDIEGVQPAALDQPRVNIHLRRTVNGDPLTAKAEGEKTINIQAFLDTGASGILLSGKTAQALGVQHETTRAGATPRRSGAPPQDPEVKFTDIGVGGGDTFAVSEKLFVYVAPYSSKSEPDEAKDYPLRVGPVRAQISEGGGLMDMLTGGLDVLGMPAMIGRIVIIDPKPVDTFSDMCRTGVFEKGKANVPKTDRHIKLSYVNFKRFTKTNPKSAEGPTIAENPMIGPNPIPAKDAPESKVPPVVAVMNGNKAEGTWLLDTGAAASFISSETAKKLGIRPDAIPEKEKFSLSIGGVGGMKKSPGFFLDQLIIPTTEGDPLVFKHAPVLIVDITVEDPQTHEKFTIDGNFGMNYLVASAFVTESALLPDIKNMTPSAFSWIVFDQPAGILGLKLKDQK
jgi:hypothetical protein